MKNISIKIIFAALIATALISCRQGEKGDPGPAGATGAPGSSSSSTPLYKSGSITGMLEGTTYINDSFFTLNLDYQYYKGTSDNTIVKPNEGDDFYSITRYDSTGNSYIKFEFYLDYYDNNQARTSELIPDIYNTKVTIVSNRKLSTNNMFYFGTTTSGYNNPFNVSSISLSDYSSGGNSNITIDNIFLNNISGLISFDYSLELSNNSNSTGNYASMNGSVSATPYNVVYRKGAE